LSRKTKAFLVAAGLVAGAFVLALASSVELFADRGPVHVSYPAGEVKEMRVLGLLDVYVDGEPKPGFSVLGAIALFVLATASFMTMAVLRLAGARRRLVWFWLIAAAGLAVAAADELFAIHESVGHNLPFLADVPGVKRPDDLVLALYLPAALAFGWWFRDVLREHRATLAFLAASVALFALSVSGDLLSLRAEEWFELLAGLCVAAGLVALMRRHLGDELRPGVTAVKPADEVRVRRVSREYEPLGR
jgi:hypothetical protein